jgi:hypothetical protein
MLHWRVTDERGEPFGAHTSELATTSGMSKAALNWLMTAATMPASPRSPRARPLAEGMRGIAVY